MTKKLSQAFAIALVLFSAIGLANAKGVRLSKAELEEARQTAANAQAQADAEEAEPKVYESYMDRMVPYDLGGIAVAGVAMRIDNNPTRGYLLGNGSFAAAGFIGHTMNDRPGAGLVSAGLRGPRSASLPHWSSTTSG